MKAQIYLHGKYFAFPYPRNLRRETFRKIPNPPLAKVDKKAKTFHSYPEFLRIKKSYRAFLIQDCSSAQHILFL